MTYLSFLIVYVNFGEKTTMKKILLFSLMINCLQHYGQQLTNPNLELWATETYGQEPSNWQYNDGTGMVYGTNNYIRNFDGVDPLTTTKVTGVAAFGGTGNSALLETKSAVGNSMLSQGLTTIPGYLYRADPITNTNIGSVSFKYKATVVPGDSCILKAGLLDANNNIISYGEFWIKPQNNSTTWLSKTIFLEQQMPGTPVTFFIEAISTYDINYSYNTPIIGSKLYLDNFNLNYCSAPLTSNATQTICDYMLPYNWNGVTFSSAGNQSATLQSAFGCDSIVNMTLSVTNGPYTLIPDVAFETKLVDLGLDPCGIDGKVPTSNISSLTTLSIGQGYNVTDLTGIEAFTSLQDLYLISTTSNSGVNLNTSNLDLSNNLSLTHFTCSRCGLQNIDLSNNLNLTYIDLGSFFNTNNNSLNTLDLSNNNLLQFVYVDMAQINNLILPSNGQIETLRASFNSLTNIDLSTNPNLERANLSYNQLTSITGSNNGQLKSLQASNNPSLIVLPTNTTNLDTLEIENCGFSGLNLDNQTSLKLLNCKSNNLECLSIKNNANNLISYINTSNNFNLTCIQVDDSTYSTNNPVWNANKDSWSNYSENCNYSCMTADLNELNKAEAFIYPNPASDEIKILLNYTSPNKFIISDETGRIVFEGVCLSNVTSVSTNNLAPGHYFIEFDKQPIKQHFVIK